MSLPCNNDLEIVHVLKSEISFAESIAKLSMHELKVDIFIPKKLASLLDTSKPDVHANDYAPIRERNILLFGTFYAHMYHTYYVDVRHFLMKQSSMTML